MSTVESKLYGKSLVNALYHGNKPLSFTFGSVEVEPQQKKQQLAQGESFRWEPQKPIPDYIPVVKLWKMDLAKFGDREYSELYLVVRHLDTEGNDVRVLDTRRQRNGKYAIAHVANSCELMIINVLDSDHGNQIALITGFFVSNECVVSDMDNPLLAAEAYHRYNNHGEDHPARETVRKILTRNYQGQELFYGYPAMYGVLKQASHLLIGHLDRVEALSLDLARKGHISSIHRNVITNGRTTKYAIAYENVKDHIGKGADFVGGLVACRMDRSLTNGIADRLIYDEESFRLAVDHCNQHNAEPSNKTKLQLVLFPKNRQDVFYAFPSLDEFNRVSDMGNGLYMAHDITNRYQYLHYNDDFIQSSRSIEKDKIKHHDFTSYVKPDADDEVFLNDFKERISRRSYFGMGSPEARLANEAFHDEFVQSVGKEPVVGLMKRLNAQEKLAYCESITQVPDKEVISVKCITTDFIVQVRECEAEVSDSESPSEGNISI